MRYKSNKVYPEHEFILSDNSPFSVKEAYKTLRTNIMFSLTEETCKVIVITSAEQGEAKSTTVVNLAKTFAENKEKILLMDCDLRLPSDAMKLRIKSEGGLTDVLIGKAILADTIVHFDSGLDFLASGTIPPNPTELLGSEKMKRLMEVLSKYYDYILIDTPPVGSVSDAVILSQNATGVVIVCKQNKVTIDSVRECVARLKFAGARMLGFILTGVDPTYSYYKHR